MAANAAKKTLGIALLAFALAGCSDPMSNFYTSDFIATVGDLTPQNRALRAVPAPHEPVIVSVYGFPDLTGQYKEMENTQSLSRAVTQGGSQMLIDALKNAGERRWFTILDRSDLESLIRERQIVTEMRRQYRGETEINPDALSPLAHAGIIIQGGITGYDSNTMTGGVGARYLGIGGNRKWKLDVVTVSMRAVATNTGEVLASVVVRKPIASYGTQGGIFTYVALDELLEVEGGRATNEPRQLAVQQAIEKAVMGLIAEGAEIGIWSFADKTAGAQYIADIRNQLYDGVIPANAPGPARLLRNNPARVVPTRPASRPVTVSRVLAPAAAQPRRVPEPAPVAPPPAAADETVG